MEDRGGLPFLVVEGSHREVGRQVGAACAATLREAVAFDAGLWADGAFVENLDGASPSAAGSADAP